MPLNRSPRAHDQRLPWDVLYLVYNNLAPSDLASTCMVSYESLATSAPMLYREVEASTVDSLLLLFGDRSSTSEVSRINPFLSLSNIRSLTIDLSSSNPDTRLSLYHHPLPFASISRPLRLDIFRFSWFSPSIEASNHQYIFKSLLPQLNPRRLDFTQVRPPGPRVQHHLTMNPANFPWSTLGLDLDLWTRLRVVDVRGDARNRVGEPIADLLLALPRRTIRGLRQRRIHVTGITNELILAFVAALAMSTDSHGWFQEDEGAGGKLVLVVSSEAQKGQVEAALKAFKREGRRWTVELEKEDEKDSSIDSDAICSTEDPLNPSSHQESSLFDPRATSCFFYCSPSDVGLQTDTYPISAPNSSDSLINRLHLDASDDSSSSDDSGSSSSSSNPSSSFSSITSSIGNLCLLDPATQWYMSQSISSPSSDPPTAASSDSSEFGLAKLFQSLQSRIDDLEMEFKNAQKIARSEVEARRAAETRADALGRRVRELTDVESEAERLRMQNARLEAMLWDRVVESSS